MEGSDGSEQSDNFYDSCKVFFSQEEIMVKSLYVFLLLKFATMVEINRCEVFLCVTMRNFFLHFLRFDF